MHERSKHPEIQEIFPAGDTGEVAESVPQNPLEGPEDLSLLEETLAHTRRGWLKYEKWKNVTAGLTDNPHFNLSHPVTLLYANILEGMLVPFSRIPGEKSGMGSSGMIGPRMLHIMGEKPEFMVCAGHIRIVEGKVYFRYGGFVNEEQRLSRFHQSIKLLQDAVDSYGLSYIRVEFFLNMCDMPFSFLSAIAPTRAGYPIFSTQGAVGTTDIIIPDPVDLFLSYLPDLSDQVPWSKKVPKAVFRGASTNYDLYDYNWRASPRFRLHRLSDSYPNLIDARITRFERHRPEHIRVMKKDGIVPHEDLGPRQKSAFKYEVVADGGVGTSRTCGVLLSNRVMIRQKSAFSQFFEALLRPGVHYLETEHHFQDLHLTVKRATEHDLELQQMVENANQASRYACTWEGRSLYWAIALAKYHVEAMEDPKEVKVPLKICGGQKPRALIGPHAGYGDGGPKCGTLQAERGQPRCSYFCTEGPILKINWQWLSSDQLENVERIGPHLPNRI